MSLPCPGHKGQDDAATLFGTFIHALMSTEEGLELALPFIFHLDAVVKPSAEVGE